MEPFWIKNYPENVPSDINPKQFATILELIDKAISEHGPKIAFTNFGHSLSFNDISRLSLRFASFLQNNIRLKKGDAIALMLPNLLQYPVAIMGALRAGLTVVNVNPLYTPRELRYLLKESEAKAIVILENFGKTLEEVLPDSFVEHVFLTRMGDLLPFPKSALINFVIKYIKKMVPHFELPGVFSFKTAIEEGDESRYQRPSLSGEDVAFLQFTGGTTGPAKGAMLTHSNMVANTLQVLTWFLQGPGVKLSPAICPLPLYHIFALLADCFVYFSMGVECILITNPRDLKGFIKELRKTEFSSIIGVNTLFKALLNHPRFRSIDFSHLQLALGGGMAVEKDVADKWQKMTGRPLHEAYGLTEASPAVSINALDIKVFTGSIGFPLPSTLVSIRDESGKELEVGEEGELWVKGPQVFKGYWRNETDTKKVLTDDAWLHTGDIAKLNQQGLIFILDRKKDMINVSGFNVYPSEIEDIVTRHEKVLEACAVAVPDEKSGEAVKLFVVKKQDDLTKEELVAYCRENLVSYKVPKIIEWRQDLPKSPVGKILRKDLKNIL
ncbi:MAG: AMP-binding protein [Deltaproteobacteria bacterium]|nr:AMP-binding protein [Deltaproteobacteria bacterium]